MRASSAPAANPPPDRRKSARYSLSVPCTVASEGTTFGVYWSEDLGAHGALLNHGGTFAKGALLELTMHFPWTGSVRMEAVVVRHQRSKCAVRFRSTTALGAALARSRIAQAVELRQTEPNHSLVSLILSSRDSLYADLEDEIGGLGGSPVVANRPLDAVWHLSDSDQLVGAIFTDCALLQNDGTSWFRFLDQAFPNVTRVLVSEEPFSFDVSALLASRRVHAAMVAPWRRDYLADLVRIDARTRISSVDLLEHEYSTAVAPWT